MDEEAFTGSTGKLIKRVPTLKEPSTIFSAIESIQYYNKEACSMRVLWKSPGRLYETFGFPKNSPFLPFFKLAYQKFRESGALVKTSNLWVNPIKLQCKKDSELKPIQKERVFLLFTLLTCGTILAFVVLAAEFFYHKALVPNKTHCFWVRSTPKPQKSPDQTT